MSITYKSTCVAFWLLLVIHVSLRGQTPSPSATEEPPAASPITITVDKAGNLVLQSSDPAALDRLEEIMQANRPPRRPYDIFEVEHARATWIKLNLDEYFEKEEDNQNNRGFGYFFYGFDDNKEKEKARQLGDRPKLRFIADNDTNTIVVQGADEIDRQTIKDLIELWDVPEPNNEDESRFTELVRIQYSRAESIANTIKEAYRDLLSANDKTFQEPAGEENKREGKGSGGSVGAGGGMSFAFKGRLSVGVDAATNSILISAEGKPLLELIVNMVKELDAGARREGNMEVHYLNPTVSGQSVRDALNKLLNTPRQSQDPKQKGDPNQAQPDQNQDVGGEQPGGKSQSNGNSRSNRR